MGSISFSRLRLFERCPLRYRLRYLDRRPPPRETADAFVGKRVHESLEWLHRRLLDGATVSTAALVADFDRRWQKELHPRVAPVDAERSCADYRRRGHDCLRTYVEAMLPRDPTRTLALETPIEMPLDAAGRFRLVGRIDRLAESPDGVLEVQDFKTSRRPPSPEELAGDAQLGLYQLAVEARWPGRRVRLVYHYVATGRSFAIVRRREELSALRRTTVELASRIEDTRVFPARVGPQCDACPYLTECPAHPAPRAEGAQLRLW